MTVFQGFSQTGRMSAQWIFKCNPRHIVSVIVCLLMLAAAGVASAQTTYWVSPSGNDTNAGTYSAPFLTFQAAADAATTPGDTVVFMDGTYSMACNPNTGHPVSWCDAAVLANQGSASAPITFMAQHRGKAILDGEAGSGWTETNGTWSCPGANTYLYLRTATYVVIQGFTIQNTCYNAVNDNDVAQNITLRWNDVSNAGLNLPATIPPATGTTSNTVAGFYCGGASGTGASGVVLDGNSVHDINANPLVGSFGDHALYINCPNVTITNNIFYNIDNGFDIQLAGVEGSGQEGTGNILIANNTFGQTDPTNSNPNDTELYSEIVIWNGNETIDSQINGITVQNNIFYNPARANENAIQGDDPNLNNCVIDSNIVTNTAGLYDDGGGNQVGQPCVELDETTATPQFPGLLDTDAGPNPEVMVSPGNPGISPENNGFDLAPFNPTNPNPAVDTGDFLSPPYLDPSLGVTVYYPAPYLSGFDFGSTDFAKRCRPQDSGDIAGNTEIDIGAFQYPQTCE